MNNIIESYLDREDWRVNENANVGYSIGGLILHNSGAATANYWLYEVYDKKIRQYHKNGYMHIHDLGMLSTYCCGWSLRDLISEGLNGVENKTASKPPKHLSSLCQTMINHLGVLQNECAGAQAYSSFDTYLAPFVRADNLSYDEVKQCIQSFVFGVNVSSRWGCVDSDTTILTPNGFKKYDEVNVGDDIYTWNDGKMNIQPVQKMNVYDYNGDMIKFSGRDYEQFVTPNHRVLRKKFNKHGEYEIKTAEELEKFNTPMSFPVAMLENEITSGIDLTDDQISLLSILYRDGSIYQKSENCIRYTITKSDNRMKNYDIIGLLERLDISYRYATKDSGFEGGSRCNNFIFHMSDNKWIRDYFSTKKKIDEKLFKMSKKQAELFLHVWTLFDGSIINQVQCQCDTDEVQDGIQHIAFLACIGSRKYERIKKGQKNPIKYVRLYKRKNKGNSKIERVPYSGIVWCPTVKDGVVVFRKNGRVFISANSQAMFSNITVDWTVPNDLKDSPAIVGGKLLDTNYSDYQKEMDIINKVLIEIMLEGDAEGRIFNYPIITYNLTDDFDWTSKNANSLFKMTGKFGNCYFANFINSSLDPSEIRSMCPLCPNTEVRVYDVDTNKIKNLDIKTIADETENNKKQYQVWTGTNWSNAKPIKMPLTDVYRITMENGDAVEMGENHLQPIYKDDIFDTIKAKDITVDMLIPYDSEKDTRFVKVISVEKVDVDYESLYCFEVEDDSHLFMLAGGMLTHNCRLRLDKRELKRRGGGLFGAGELTGSVGVVTLNMPRIGYTAKNEEQYFDLLSETMDVAKQSLELKREFLNEKLKKGLYPYIKRYLHSWRNHFSTIGLVGMNESMENFMDKNLTDSEAIAFTEKVLDFMNNKLSDYQEETGNLYNLEASPAEGTSYRLAKIDNKRYKNIKQAGDNVPYYTNSTQLPVGHTDDIFEALDIQDSIQAKYTGGTVFHTLLGEGIDDYVTVRNLVKKIATNYSIPYFTISPTFSTCMDHGYIQGEKFKCPKCGKETEVYARIVGYYRPIKNWNDGKKSEYTDRVEFKLGESNEKIEK